MTRSHASMERPQGTYPETNSYCLRSTGCNRVGSILFHGRIAKAWCKQPIGTYYKIRQPGDSFTPDQWMRTVIKELWEFSITIWKQRNAELHGTDGAISMEQRRKDTANNEAVAVYQLTIGKVSPTDSVVLHHARIEEILKWMKEHLDAYLASAHVIIDQRDQPG
jgi:hypothetical protein